MSVKDFEWSDWTADTAAIVVVTVAAFLSVLGLAAYRAWLVSLAWGWLIVPLYSVREITWLQVLVLVFVWRLGFGRIMETRKGQLSENLKNIAEQVLGWTLMACICWLVAWWFV